MHHYPEDCVKARIFVTNIWIEKKYKSNYLSAINESKKNIKAEYLSAINES